MEPAPTAKQRRSRRKNGPSLIFVDETEPFRIGRQNESTRLVIRHQAARSGCRNRRRARGTDRGNDSDGSPQEEELELAASAPVQDPGSLVLPSYNGYETMRAKLNFDITCLTSFTNTDLTARASSLIQENPRLAGSLLQRWPSCFLSYLPSRYGSRPFVDDAMRCVAARAAHMMGISPSPLLHTALYSRALASLGAAVKAPDPSLISDIYCATRLLVLYESLGPPNQNALTFHNDAGIDIIKQIEPSRSLSAFDRALIRSQGPYVVTKAIFKRESSLFETRKWQAFFDHAAREETDADSRLSWKFVGAISFIAGILRDVQALFESALPMSRSEYAALSNDILERSGRIRRSFEAAHLEYQQRPPYPPSLFDLAVAAESPGRVQVRGIFFHSMIFLCRVRATFAATAQERAASEDEAQALAAQAVLAASTAQSYAPELAWNLEERSDVVRSILRTRDDWVPAREPETKTWEEQTGLLLRRLQRWFTLWTSDYLVPELRWSASSDAGEGINEEEP
ncbi:hypothetical protein PG997_002055 [Apiospora hydei]|uniref:Uncharacterized protein n=1 Tax=Apiospora hydei TaxID=1337664 RepID=A0ABR1X8E0_9PEZI